MKHISNFLDFLGEGRAKPNEWTEYLFLVGGKVVYGVDINGRFSKSELAQETKKVEKMFNVSGIVVKERTYYQ